MIDCIQISRRNFYSSTHKLLYEYNNIYSDNIDSLISEFLLAGSGRYNRLQSTIFIFFFFFFFFVVCVEKSQTKQEEDTQKKYIERERNDAQEKK